MMGTLPLDHGERGIMAPTARMSRETSSSSRRPNRRAMESVRRWYRNRYRMSGMAQCSQYARWVRGA